MRNSLIFLFSLMFFYLIWPYIAVFSLYISLKTGDEAGLEERVDWPLLKNALKLNLDKIVAIKLKENLNKKEIQLSFDSLTISKQISDKIATPIGLIYLFNKPNEFVEQIRQTFTNTITPEKITPTSPQKKSFDPEGPNFPSLFKQIEYAFFVKPNRFRLSINHDRLLFSVEWQLQTIFWRLTSVEIPINEI